MKQGIADKQDTERTGVQASIHWLSESEGGRKQLPSGHRYSTVVRFPDGQDASEHSWSIVAELLGEPAQTSSARVYFLADTAPHHLLKSGITFELLEGNRVVATGHVL
jgi:hypothetical protein